MKTDTSTFLAQQIVRLRRRDQIRRLMQRDKTPLAILFMAAVVGTLTGLVGVAFEKAVSWVQNMRIGALVQVADHAFLLWPLAFILSALLAMVGYFLVRKFAPEAGGSGIPEIEGALEELRPVRWWRVLPVKFIGGMGTLGAGMVLGREGPTVQIGGNLGRMVLDVFRMRSAEARHTLLATGVGGGIIRDVLAREIPMILRTEIYATACIIGGIVHATAFYTFSVPLESASMMGMVVTLFIRLAAIRWHLKLPTFALDENGR